MEISREVGVDWRMVALRLGVTKTEIDEINHNYPTLTEQCYQAFRIWADKRGGFERANPCEIADALMKVPLKRIVDHYFVKVI